MAELVTRRSYACVALTWNVNEQRPEDSATFAALREAAKDAHLVAVGLQVRHRCAFDRLCMLHWPCIQVRILDGHMPPSVTDSNADERGVYLHPVDPELYVRSGTVVNGVLVTS
jgi:hypothetical protein